MRKSQVKFVTQFSIVLCALLLAGSAPKANTQMPGAHPGYLHAIQDLREARETLHWKFGQPAHIQAAATAGSLIDAAIADLKNASKLDDKLTGKYPTPDPTIPDLGRFHKVNELLHEAHHEIDVPESDRVALPFRDSARRHIDEAIASIKTVL